MVQLVIDINFTLTDQGFINNLLKTDHCVESNNISRINLKG
jgi:hypothetical protein